MNIPMQASPTIQYVVYDKTTGQILHQHTRYSAEKNAHVEVPLDELKASLFTDGSILARVTGKDAANLDIIQVGPKTPGAERLGRMVVDPKTRVLVDKPALTLTPDKTQIAGDGQASVKIAIRAVGADGKPVRSLDDKLKVVTSRGKLSATGGLVELVQGQATITLTSVNETVSRVMVKASSIAGVCVTGDVRLEFV